MQKKHKFTKSAFSLVEMLMALLVASLLMAALAPVMTRKINENVSITSNFTENGRHQTLKLKYGSKNEAEGWDCTNIIKDSQGNELYCEGEFIVPAAFHNITVTAIGGGGGGGTAPTAGYVEYTTAGSTNDFTVPAMTDTIEATLINAGAGGGAGGQTRVNHTFVTSGNANVAQDKWNLLTASSTGWVTYTPPAILRGKYYLVTACGGGGGGGGAGANAITPKTFGAGGGSGGYFVDNVAPLTAPESGNLTMTIGGGGGGGGGDDRRGRDGRIFDGGGGGSSIPEQSKPGFSATTGGFGGVCTDNAYGTGGGGGNYSATNGHAWASGSSIILGGTPAGNAGKGGNAFPTMNNPGAENKAAGGGGGGGSYQGGGGGGAPGGSGGGGGARTVLYTAPGNSSPLFAAGGGGGGGGGYFYYSGAVLNHWGTGGGGGGGAGDGGGNGGDGASWINEASPGYGGSGGYAGKNTDGGQVTTLFGSNYCNGGNGGKTDNATGSDGKDGALRISYLSYGTGGSGGGSGRIDAIYPLTVTANETLKVKIARGGAGGKAGYINNSGIVAPTDAECQSDGGTRILRGSNILLGQARTCWVGGWIGSSRGISCAHRGSASRSEGGYIYSPLGSALPVDGGMSNANYPKGFFSTNGNPAGYPTGQANQNCDASSIAAETAGGRGGTGTTPFTGTCTAGGGGTASSPTGKNASGYGCGGGGGYGLADGGAGSGGYARISWNKYWDTTLNGGNGDYKMKTLGAGGGGASGNIIKDTIRVTEGQVIKIRIGAGGKGAMVINNTPINATAGGTTIFGSEEFIQIKAGGGGGGGNPSITNGKITKGAGGTPSTICTSGSKNYINNKSYCTKGTTGGAPNGDAVNTPQGGAGAAFTYMLGSETFTGKSGAGGVQSTELENSKGKTPETNSIASGGGGAALLRYSDRITNMSTVTNPSGGNGAPGAIILQLWE